jgi:hypothetical protein
MADSKTLSSASRVAARGTTVAFGICLCRNRTHWPAFKALLQWFVDHSVGLAPREKSCIQSPRAYRFSSNRCEVC